MAEKIVQIDHVTKKYKERTVPLHHKSLLFSDS